LSFIALVVLLAIISFLYKHLTKRKQIFLKNRKHASFLTAK